jgi:hypothetical protein
MNKLIKISKVSAIVILSLMLMLFIASQIMQEKVAVIILNSLNKNVSTKLEAGSFHLSFLKKFPKASLELRNVLVHSSERFDKISFGAVNTDTLMAARIVSVEFRMSDILKSNYKIERIGAKSGVLHLFSDMAGNVNYEIASKTENKGTDDFAINLEKIYLTDIYATYNNLATKLLLEGTVDEGRLKINISGEDIDFLADADLNIAGLHLYNTHITRNFKAKLDLSLKSSEKGVLFRKGKLTIDDYDFTLAGFISSENVLDLKLTGNNISISKIKNYLPEKYFNFISRYNPSGILVVNSIFKGQLSRTSNPHIETNCLLSKGRITYGNRNLSIEDLSFSGHFTNGSKNRQETSSISVKDIRMKFGSAQYAGSFLMTRLNDPRAELSVSGTVFPAEIREFFDLKVLSSAGGSADIDFTLKSESWPGKNVSFASILALKPVGRIRFNSFLLGLNHDSLLVKQLTGDVSLANTTRSEGLDFIFNNQHIKLSGEFYNLPEWVAGGDVLVQGTADVSFSRLIPEVFLNQNSTAGDQSAFNLPDDIILDLKFKADTLDYKTFSSRKVSGSLTYRPRLLTFNSLNIEALSGVISGNGFVTQNADKSFISKGSFKLNDVDINKSFTTFKNFGQDFIKAENISGTLSGTLTLLLPMDSLLKPVIKSITAEGNYLLSNGALIDFDPIKELSDFIELSELENIRFEEMENDFFIRNNVVYTPQMDIRSSAADLSINGNHDFDNKYEYHIKMLLSEILSKKHRKNSSQVTEFGVVEDDGLGRTSILLKIEGNNEDVKVGYDFKAATAGVKNNMKKEKENLKTILNQEYGWFKTDSAPKAKPAEKKPRFRISWEETDSVKQNTPPPAEEKKEAGFKSLFKKKG